MVGDARGGCNGEANQFSHWALQPHHQLLAMFAYLGLDRNKPDTASRRLRNGGWPATDISPAVKTVVSWCSKLARRAEWAERVGRVVPKLLHLPTSSSLPARLGQQYWVASWWLLIS